MPLAIVGPTASGKSSLGVEVARRLGTVVVNGDPFQALQGLPIGTGQPSPEEQGGVPHVGYGCLPLATRPNPVAFGDWVRDRLAIHPEAVVVTGSGLYLKGIWEQLDRLPEVPADLVARVRDWFRVLPAPVLHRYLGVVDAQRASELHPRDGARIQRALALHLATGERPSSLLSRPRIEIPKGWRCLLVLPTRERQRARVAQRVRAMAQAGWAQEVQGLVAAGHGDDLRALRPLGYLEWMEGGSSEEILRAITQATQAYAKRQVTFFQRQWPELPTWDPDAEPLESALARLSVPSISAP